MNFLRLVSPFTIAAKMNVHRVVDDFVVTNQDDVDSN
jgi:hypothetical protein